MERQTISAKLMQGRSHHSQCILPICNFPLIYTKLISLLIKCNKVQRHGTADGKWKLFCLFAETFIQEVFTTALEETAINSFARSSIIRKMVSVDGRDGKRETSRLIQRIVADPAQH